MMNCLPNQIQTRSRRFHPTRFKLKKAEAELMKIRDKNRLTRLIAYLSEDMPETYLIDADVYCPHEDASRVTANWTWGYRELYPEEEKFLRLIRENAPVYLEASINHRAYTIELFYAEREVDDSPYLIIEFKKGTQLTFGSNGFVGSNDESSFKVLLHEDGSLLFEHKKRWIPLTLSTLSKQMRGEIFIDFWHRLFLFLGENQFLYRDFAKIYHPNQKIYPKLPFQFNQALTCSTQRELLQAHFKGQSVPKALNKASLYMAYLLMKCRKYVKEEEWVKLFSLIGEDQAFRFFFYHREDSIYTQPRSSLREQIQRCFFLYYSKTIPEVDTDVLDDYLSMALQYERKVQFNLKIKSTRRIQEEHDRVMIRYQEAETPELNFPKRSQFKQLILPKDFEEITTRQRLIKESRIQHHCVWSYASDINQDHCRIFSILYNGDRYTLEVRRKDNVFINHQLRGYRNQDAPQSLHDYVAQCLTQASACLKRNTHSA